MTKPMYAPIGPTRHYPHKWYSGPDYQDHQKYYAWLKHRSQASFRNEQHDLTWLDWLAFWPDDVWIQRGRRSHEVVLTRRDHQGSWSRDNCHIITRGEHLMAVSSRKLGTKYRVKVKL
jgi:hypothetical protein